MTTKKFLVTVRGEESWQPDFIDITEWNPLWDSADECIDVPQELVDRYHQALEEDTQAAMRLQAIKEEFLAIATAAHSAE